MRLPVPGSLASLALLPSLPPMGRLPRAFGRIPLLPGGQALFNSFPPASWCFRLAPAGFEGYVPPTSPCIPENLDSSAMPTTEFDAKRELICWLVADLTNQRNELDTELVAFLERLAGRALFFIPQLGDLGGRAPKILEAVKQEKLPKESNRLGKDDLYRAINVNEGMSLWAALKVIETLQALASSTNPDHRELVSVKGAPMQFGAGCIVPSIFHVDPEDLRPLFNGRDYLQFATEILKGTLLPNAIRMLAQGEGNGERSYTEFRVTMRFVDTFVGALTGTRNIFSADPLRGPRNGQNTTALRKANGNLTQMVRATQGSRPKD